MTGQSFSGLRAAPHDPKKQVAQIGLTAEARTSKGKSTETHYLKKDRTGFGGGFKIPEECRVKKEQMKKKKKLATHSDDEDKDKDQSGLTKDEIFAHLNLGNADTGISGKNG